MCILGAMPFAILGFFKYNGMPAEKVIMCFIKTNFLIPRKMMFKPKNYYYELTKNYIENKEREGLNENTKKSI